MPSGVSTLDAGVRRPGARIRVRFAAALIASALLHAGLTTMFAPGPGARAARVKAGGGSSPLAVRLLPAEEALPAPSASEHDAPAERARVRRPKRAPTRAIPAARAPHANDRQDESSVLAEAADTTYYGARQLDRYPELIVALELTFPEAIAASVSSGYVLLLVLIDAEGRVNDASVVEAAPAGVFDEGAKSALLSARFKPALKDGRAVRSRLIVHVNYGKPD